jgi:hypothetical protein
MLKYLLLFPLLLPAVLSNAQVREIMGLVTYNNERLSGAVIKNLNIHSQIVSNDRGEFIINVQTGDSIITVKDNYIKDTLLVAHQQYLIIQLHKNPLMLKEVEINSSSISPESIYAANKKEYKMIYFNGDKSGIFLSGSLVNVDKLNNALGKKGHDARRLQSRLTEDYKNEIIDKRFNPLAARVTGYKGKQLRDFIQNNRPPYNLVINATDYDIDQYIKRKLLENKKR